MLTIGRRSFTVTMVPDHSEALRGIISVGVATDVVVTDQDSDNVLSVSDVIPSVTLQPYFKSALQRVGESLYHMICEQFPDLIKTYQVNLFTYKNCCSGSDLVDWVMNHSVIPRARNEVVRMWQALLEERVIYHVFNVYSFKDDPNLMYKFNTELNSENKEDVLSIPNDDTRKSRSSSTASSVISSLPGDYSDIALEDCFEMLAQLAPEALVSASLSKRPDQRTEEDIECIYDEMVNIKAFSHFSQTVKSELSKCIIFDDFRDQTGHMLFHQGDEGTSWYIIYRGSVNVIVHGKGVVCTLHEGDEFGKLALVNNAPRAASIQLREAHCSFLRVDKGDFNRILKSVEANTVRLREHGQDVLVLEKLNEKYSVVLGTPDKVIDHMIEQKADSDEREDALEFDFFLTHQLFISVSELCNAMMQKYQGEGTIKESATLEQKRSRKARIARCVIKWVEIGGQELVAEESFKDFGTELCTQLAADNLNDVLSILREKIMKHSPRKNSGHKLKSLSISATSIPATRKTLRSVFSAGSQDITIGNPTLQPCLHTDQVTLDVYTVDHQSCQLVVTRAAIAKDIQYHVAKELGLPSSDYQLCEVRSSGEFVPFRDTETSLDTALSVNGKIFIIPNNFEGRVPILKTQDILGASFPFDKESSKDVACHLMLYSFELLHNISPREVVYRACGKHKFSRITSNIDLIIRRFNEIQFWTISEVCGSPDVAARARILSKFIKIATYCKGFNDLNSFFAIVFGLMNGAISRLKHTWEKVPTKLRRNFETFETLTDPSRNHRAIRQYQGKLLPPVIPFMPLLLKDTTFINEGNETCIDGLVNFEKMRMLSAKARMLKQFSQGVLNPEVISITGRTPEMEHGIRNLKVIDNQRTLSHMSNSVEKK